MAHEIKVVLTPDIPNGFRPDTFGHLLQQRVQVPGLDTRWVHTLVGAVVAADGDSAELTVHSEPLAAVSMDEGFRFEHGVPMARVRVVSPGGESLLAELQLNAPLQQGQRISIGDQEYVVQATEWPGRDPVTGVCAGGVDWQHAYAVPVEPVVSVPVLAEALPDGPAVAGAAAVFRGPGRVG